MSDELNYSKQSDETFSDIGRRKVSFTTSDVPDDGRINSINSSMPIITNDDDMSALIDEDATFSRTQHAYSTTSEFSMHTESREHIHSSVIASLIASIVGSVRKLERSVGYIQSFSLLVGIIIGSGIFITPSFVIHDVKDVGMSIMIWVICGVIVLLGALCYCELGTAIKTAGGNYAYILHVYGPVPAFLCSWTQVLIVDPTSVAAISLTLGNYVMKPFEDMIETNQWYAKAISAGCILIIAIVNCASVKAATAMQCVFTTCQMLSVLLIVVLGCWQLGAGHTQNFKHLFGNAEFNLNAIGPIGAAFFASLFAYNGWQMAGNITEDMINVERTLLLTVLTAVPFITISYVAVNIAFLSVLTPTQVGESHAVAVDFITALFGKNVAYIVPVLVTLSCYGSANGCIFSCGRLSLAAGREGHMPELLGMIHRTRRTPIPAICLTSSIAILLLVPDGSNLQNLINLATIANWFITLIVIIGIIVLRVRQPDLPRPFKVWLIIPIIMIFVSLFLVVIPFTERPVNSAAAVGFILLGLPMYLIFVYFAPRHPNIFNTCRGSVTAFLKKILNLAPCV